jgi:DNA-directed RNA polymerase subunit RPC12/RpoP
MVKKRPNFPSAGRRRRRVKMEVIPEPARGAASVIVADVLPAIRYENPAADAFDYVCGRCKAVVVEGATAGSIAQLVFKCPKCSTYSRVTSLGTM